MRTELQVVPDRRGRSLDGGRRRSLACAWYLVHATERGYEGGFRAIYRARWDDMDARQQMRESAFFVRAQELRQSFLAEQGFDADELARRGIALLVVEDDLDVRLRVGPLESFSVDLELVGIDDRGTDMKLRHRFHRESDRALLAVVDVRVRWFELDKQRPTSPPQGVRDRWLELPCSDDFRVL